MTEKRLCIGRVHESIGRRRGTATPKNTVRFLQQADASRCSLDEDMREMVRQFNFELYVSEGASDIEAILNNIQVSVSEVMNNKLTVEVSDEEIERALFQMGPTKCP